MSNYGLAIQLLIDEFRVDGLQKWSLVSLLRAP